MQICGVLTALFGILVIVVAIDDAGATHMNSTKTQFGIHTYLAVSVMAIAGFQLIIGIFRPARPEAGDLKTWRRRLFEITHHITGHTAIIVALFTVLSGEYCNSKCFVL